MIFAIVLWSTMCLSSPGSVLLTESNLQATQQDDDARIEVTSKQTVVQKPYHDSSARIVQEDDQRKTSPSNELSIRNKTGCRCPEPDDPEFIPGVVWKGDQPELGLKEIALLLAPVLWFSSDEPLITQGDLPIPHPHPCDESSTKAVVYYQVTRINLRGSKEVNQPEEEDFRFFEKVKSLSLRYFFYYREDFGVKPHIHDLEVAEFQVFLEKTREGCYQVRLGNVIGFAHGVDWYYNRLEIEKDTRFPLTLFVEEGKHATCPDRNADGIYTPGYDVNKRVNDAWGVRDVLATGFLLGGTYKASMMKPRDPAFRVLPPENTLICTSKPFSSLARSSKFMDHYELRPANAVPICKDIPSEQEKLLNMMKTHRFGREYPPVQYQYEFIQDLSEPLSYTGIIPAISMRFDGEFGMSLILPGLDYGEGYLVPKINWVGDKVSLEGLITPTAAQFFSWYVTGGIAGEDLREKARLSFVSELGVKFRFRLSGKARILSLGYQFAGMRFGIRNTGFENLDSQFVVELGAGVW